MASRPERLKANLLSTIGQLARQVLARDGAPQDAGTAANRFLDLYYMQVSPDDLLDARPEALTGAALAVWRFAQSRMPGTPKIRVYNPTIDEHGWTSSHTVIEIVNDDMPFLVDSVTGWLTSHNITVHLIIHPILRVKRDGKGTLTELLGGDGAGAHKRDGGNGEGVISESVMHLEIDEQPTAAARDEVLDGINAVLADVRAAVADWEPMRQRLATVLKGLSPTPPGVPAEEGEEARAFLAWLDNNHFTYLGYREYAFGGDADEPGIGTVVAESGLGLLREADARIFHPTTEASALPPDIRALVRSPKLLMISKANRRSTVHRPVPMDTVGIKKIAADGRVTGEYRFIGLFTSQAYNLSPRLIPLLRHKIECVMQRSGLAPNSHDGKALLNILETYPRDELFQISEDDLYDISLGILQLQERSRVALFIRRDPFERFLSCLIFAPRERFDTDLRLKFQEILCEELNGTVSAYYTQIGDSPLARLHLIIKTKPGEVPTFDSEQIERRLARAARAWPDELRESLIEAHGEDAGLAVMRRFADAFPTAYRERTSAASAVQDIERIERTRQTGKLSLTLYRPIDASDDSVRLKIYHATDAVPLSDVLPMLENLGFKVIDELPSLIEPAADGATAAARIWIHDFGMRTRDAQPLALDQLKPLIEEAFARLWAEEMENDGFNKLVIAAGLNWREVTIIRAYSKYLRQAGITYSQAYMEDTFLHNPGFARLIADLFAVRSNPAMQAKAAVRETELKQQYEDALDGVASLDEDRILRRFLNLVLSMLRTNFYQKAADGGPKPYLSFKLDSRAVDELPLPRPLYEIFVYSPRMEGIHLRGGKVARGGIRWSDRREDFRTEILGLMKAQMVKNAVIVPVGAKGGFVVKRPPASGTREALQEEGIACYKTLMRGLLDITDNYKGASVIAPKDVVRHDGDDPYLVVAADKGTATFSDIANGIARDYGFWLDDAFASGGSAGYDHKKIGITARGAWESVKRHFRELGVDTQSQDFTVVGVGDMSGDVFGNGMLRSPHIKLLAAFNHLHIFVDPTPDPAASFAERQRLFDLPRSSWSDYDATLISKGGGVFDRKAKSIKLTPEIQALFDIQQEAVPPSDLIRAILKARVDLLFFGGIGTFIKSASETQADAGDRANDALRIDGREARAKVIGEGANLGVTQLGRIDYARNGGPEGTGGKINTDAIDNSGGVDASDHEVNLKILLGAVVDEGDLTMKQRDKLLFSMTDELAELILRDNYLQTQALSVMEAQNVQQLDDQQHFIKALERVGKLNRDVEKLPSVEAIAALAAAGKGLTRPELAVLLAYGKLWLYEELLGSNLPDEAFLIEDLYRYFPTAVRDSFKDAIARHRLRREIIATVATNSMVNRVGPTFVHQMIDRTGCPPGDVAHAYTVTRDGFALRDLWAGIEALDAKVPAQTQIAMIRETGRLVSRCTLWFLQNMTHPIDVGAAIADVKPGIELLTAKMIDVLPHEDRTRLQERAQNYIQDGAPEDLALAIARLDWLGAAPDIIRLASRDVNTVMDVARLYYGLGAALDLKWLRQAARSVAAKTSWQKQAVAAVIEDLYAFQAEITSRVLASGQSAEAWIAARGSAAQRITQLTDDMKAAPAIDIAMLAVASRQLRALIAG